jgi:5'(3')-deoxyribonucleotidase
MHFTHKKWSVDIDVLVDDSPAKLGMFKKKSINKGVPIVFRQTWNTKSQKSKLTIDRLSDLMYVCFGK